MKPFVVKESGALVRAFGAKTLTAFAADPWIDGIVRGTVVKIEPVVGPEGQVDTILTVSVERGMNLPAGSLIKVREPGGRVPLRAVRDQFEGKDWQKPLTEADLSRTVDFQREGFSHSGVGEDSVMLLHAVSSVAAYQYSLATRLVAIDGGFRFKNDDPPNHAWSRSLTAAEAADLVEGAGG